MVQLAIQCRNKHCQQTQINHNLHYVTTQYTTTQSPLVHCPMCPATTDYLRVRPLDYSDHLSLIYPMLPRLIATACINEYNNLQQTQYFKIRRTRKSPTVNARKFSTVEEYVLFMFPKLITSNGICPLHVSCNDCRSTFTVLRTNPTSSSLPKFCIWCSSQNVTVTLPSTDDTANICLNLDLIEESQIIALADDYSIPVVLMTAIYKMWNQQSKIKTIKEWMDTDGIKAIINKVQTNVTAV